MKLDLPLMLISSKFVFIAETRCLCQGDLSTTCYISELSSDASSPPPTLFALSTNWNLDLGCSLSLKE